MPAEFRAMRRHRQQLSAEETAAILTRCSHGILACVGDSGLPYAVPLSYVYLNDSIYFHSATAGHKVDALRAHPEVSFAVVDGDLILSEAYTTVYRSVIAFGRARFVSGEECLLALRALADKYSGDRPEEERNRVSAGCDRTLVIAVDIDHVTGKQAKELMPGT